MTCQICKVKITDKNTGNIESIFGKTVLSPAEQERFDRVKKPITVCVGCRHDLLMAQLVSIAGSGV